MGSGKRSVNELHYCTQQLQRRYLETRPSWKSGAPVAANAGWLAGWDVFASSSSHGGRQCTTHLSQETPPLKMKVTSFVLRTSMSSRRRLDRDDNSISEIY